MMNFNRSDDQRMLADSLSRYLKDHYTHDHRMTAITSESGYDSTTYKALCDLGIVGALLPESCGGYGGSGSDIAVVFEEAGRALTVDPLLSAVMCGNLLADIALTSHSTLLDQLISGDKTVSLAHYEPGARYQLDSIQCTADLSEGKWTISGQKNQVLNAASADYFIVLARNEKTENTQSGLSLFLIDKNTAGLTINSYPTIDGGHSGDIILENAHITESQLLGTAGNAYPAFEKAIARGVLALCAEAYGVMCICKDMTIDYLQTRNQFGVPLGKFQALQHRLVDVVIEIEQAQSAVINAAYSLEQDRNQREAQISAAKNLIGRTAKLVAEESIQMHGGIAMTWEYSLSHYAKRLIMIDHQLGDTDYHLQRYIDFTTR